MNNAPKYLYFESNTTDSYACIYIFRQGVTQVRMMENQVIIS